MEEGRILRAATPRQKLEIKLAGSSVYTSVIAPTSSSLEPIMTDVWHGSQQSTNFDSTGE